MKDRYSRYVFVGAAFCFIILRGFMSDKFKFDWLSLTLFVIALIVGLDPHFSENLSKLLSRLKHLKFAGAEMQFEEKVSEVDKSLKQEEEGKKEEIKGSPKAQELTQDLKEEVYKVVKNGIEPARGVVLTDEKIKQSLESLFKEIEAQEVSVVLSRKSLLKQLHERAVLDTHLYSSILKYFELADEVVENRKKHSKDEIIEVAELGLRIVQLLNLELVKSVSTKPQQPQQPKGVEFSGTQIFATSQQDAVIFTTINIVDDDGQLFPIADELTIQNFRIIESYGDIRRQAEIVDVKVFEKARIPLFLVLAIDKSDSMRQPTLGDKTSKIDRVKRTARILLNKLNSTPEIDFEKHVALLGFSGDHATRNDFLYAQNGEIWFNDLNSLLSYIDKIQTGDATPLWDALDVALEACSEKKGGRSLVICLTDGEQNRGRVNYENIKSKVQKNGVPVFTIVYGDDKASVDNLIEVSNLSGAGREGIGSFIRASSEELPNIFSTLGSTFVHSYEIKWRPTGATPRTNVMVQIEVAIRLEANIFRNSYIRHYIAN